MCGGGSMSAAVAPTGEKEAAQLAHLQRALWLAEEDVKFLNGILDAKRRYEFWKGKKDRPVATDERKWMTPKELDRFLVELASGLDKTVKSLRISCDSMEA